MDLSWPVCVIAPTFREHYWSWALLNNGAVTGEKPVVAAALLETAKGAVITEAWLTLTS